MPAGLGGVFGLPGTRNYVPVVVVFDNIVALGAAQATATILNAGINNVTSVAASTGVLLPIIEIGMEVIVRNAGANTLNVYPRMYQSINAAAVNVAYALPAGGTIMFLGMTQTAWITLGATFA
jgi:hypothetical protein